MNVKHNERGKLIYDNILQCVGHTPLVQLNKIPKKYGLECQIYAKCEFFNPGGSVKDRIAHTMIQEAEHAGLAKRGITRFVEPTSGNTGIGVSLASAVWGYKCTIVTPDKNSDEKINTMHLLGAEIIQTPAMAGADDPDNYINVTHKILKDDPNAISLNQYSNEVNPLTHHEQTAVELLEALGTVDMFVMGSGTGGTVTGVGRKLKEIQPNCKVVTVDPVGSIIFDPDDKPALYFVEGIGGDFKPPVLDEHYIDKVVKTHDSDSFNMSREMIKEEGLLCGGSSGAITFAAIQAARDYNLGPDKKVVIILPDGIRNYMTKFVTDQWMEAHLFKEIPKREFPWWPMSISNLKIIDNVAKVNEQQSCTDALKAMADDGPNYDKLVFVVDNTGCLKGVVSKDSLRSEATNPKKKGNIDFNEEVGKHLMKTFQKIAENKVYSTVGLAARILDIAPFVVVVDEPDPGSGIKPKGIITSEIVLDYIINTKK